MNNLKKWLAALLALTLCLGLAACGSGEPAFSESDYMGFWEYEDYYWIIVISDDGTWYADEDYDGAADVEGYTEFEDGVLYLYDDEGEYAVLTMQDTDTLTDGDGDTLFRTEMSDPPSDVSDPVLEDFLGYWKLDTHDIVFAIREDGTWEMLDTNGSSGGSAEYVFEDGAVTLMNGHGEPDVTLYINGADSLIDSDGDTFTRYEFEETASTLAFIPDDLPPELPSPLDPLTETTQLRDGVYINYPALMEVDGQGTDWAGFSAINEDGTDDYYTHISVHLQPCPSEWDSYFSQGKGTAEPAMRALTESIINKLYSGYIIQSIGTDFENGGSYYGLTTYLWMDGSVFLDAAPYPVRAVYETRYVGPTGYLLTIMSLAVESRINNYYGIACNMIDTITTSGDWSTAPKSLPATAGGSDPGDYGTPYYWYDSDGDVWYWNGYSNEFIGFGDDYYIEDGQYYESNDAGWDYSGDYYDDYDPWSDPGDGDDFWSDPGDTGYYWDPDAGCYMESQGGW